MKNAVLIKLALIVLVLMFGMGMLWGQFSGGNGTSGDPYQITTVADLNNVRNYLTSHFIQMNDLDLNVAPYNTGEGWVPIGNGTSVPSSTFRGVYNGNGKTISNLFINRPGAGEPSNSTQAIALPGNQGLFGYVANGSGQDALIQKLGLINPVVTGGRGTGSLVGRILLDDSTNFEARVENCYADGGTVNGFGATGGLVGANNSNRRNYVPRVVFSWANVSVNSRFPTNTVPNPNDNNDLFNIKYGGLVGCNENGLTQDSYARGNVFGGKRVGGVAGCAIRGAMLRCYATGTARTGFASPPFTAGADPFVGGVVGRTEGQLPPGLGGFTGSGTVQQCYWDTETSGNTTSAGGEGRTTTQMKTQGTFVNWDFAAVWGFQTTPTVLNDGYPILVASTPRLYFRSTGTGNWNSPSSWLASSTLDGSYTAAGVFPDYTNSLYIDIVVGTTITVTAPVSIDQTVVNGSLIVNEGVVLTVQKESGTDIQINNGGVLTVNGTLDLRGVHSIATSGGLVTGANSTIIFSGTISQSTGANFPTSVTNLTLDNEFNSSNLINFEISGALTINGVFNIINGVYSYATPNVVLTDGYDNPSKFLKVAENAVAITGLTVSSSVIAAMPAKINRKWSITGTIAAAVGENPPNTKDFTFYWTPADDNNFTWTETIKPAVYQGGIMITEGVVWSVSDPRKITVPVSSLASKAEFGIGRSDGQTLPVELSSFNAMILGSGRVRLDWITQSETNVNGYYLWRSPTSNLYHANLVSPLIRAQNTSTEMSYSFEDREVPGDGEYYYWLQNVDFDGQTAYHGPVNVQVNFGGGSIPEIPLKNELSSLYPNPFNPELNIAFGLKTKQAISIEIYNMRGQLVRRLVESEVVAGRHRVKWNGKDELGNACSAGMFFIRMTTPTEVFTRKAVMMK